MIVCNAAIEESMVNLKTAYYFFPIFALKKLI